MMNWKGFGRKRSWPNTNVLSLNLPGGTEEKHENPRQDSRTPNLDLNLGPPEYKTVMLTTTFGPTRIQYHC
jgi:hypothetical protein